MHKNRVAFKTPALALDVQVFLEIILLFLKVIQEIGDTFGIDFSGGQN